MQNKLIMAAILSLLTTAATLADNNKEDSDHTATAEKKWELQEGPDGPILKEVEKLRKQLGPEFSIESQELGIERDRAETKPPAKDKANQEWTGGKLYQEVRELVSKFRRDARHLEEMAAHAEQLSEFALADQLRSLAHRQWEAARELSQPRSTRGYRDPWQPPVAPSGTPPQNTKPSSWESGPSGLSQPKLERSPESAPSYGVPSTPKQRFSNPGSVEPKKR